MEYTLGAKIISGIISRKIIAGPLSVQMSIVDACNYRCIMCWEHSSELEGWGADELARNYHANKENKSTVMDFDIYKKLIISLHKIGSRRICFAGIGEPLLHKRIVDAVAFAKSLKMNVRLTTNGSLMTEELLEELIDANLDVLSVSINAGASDEYGLVHANQENEVFDKIVEKLVWLKEFKLSRSLRKPELSLSNVISKLNYQRVLDMMQVGIDTGANFVSYRPLHIFSNIARFEMVESDQRNLDEFFSLVKPMAVKNKIGNDIDTFSKLLAIRENKIIPAPCFAGWLFPFILANGDVTYCCVSREVLGNLGNESFESIWFSKRHQELNDMALKMHRTQESLPKSRCLGCERTIQNVRIHKYLWPLWGRPQT